MFDGQQYGSAAGRCNGRIRAVTRKGGSPRGPELPAAFVMLATQVATMQAELLALATRSAERDAALAHLLAAVSQVARSVEQLSSSQATLVDHASMIPESADRNGHIA